MQPQDFIAEHPLFTHTQFVAEHTSGGRRSRNTSNNLLAQYISSGRILRIRRGLYAAVPRGTSPASLRIDPFLLATSLTEDAVVACHAALQFHGRAYSIWYRFPFLTSGRVRPFSFRGMEFTPVQVPASIRQRSDHGGEILSLLHAGGTVRVTTLERTMVDVMHAPHHGGGWEEIWRSLEMVEFFDLETVIDYTCSLRSALTVARVGFFLERHRDQLMVEDHHLEMLRQRKPAQPRYLQRDRREPGKLITSWNLIVPDWILTRSWEEESA